MNPHPKLLTRLLTALLAVAIVGAAVLPGTAHAYRVFVGVGYPGYYYRPPPVYFAPPPAVYYPPPPVYYAPPVAYAPRPFSSRCATAAAICPLRVPGPVGDACSCPVPGGRMLGRIG